MAVGVDHQVAVHAVATHGQVGGRSCPVVLRAFADVLPDDVEDAHCNYANRCAFNWPVCALILATNATAEPNFLVVVFQSYWFFIRPQNR